MKMRYTGPRHDYARIEGVLRERFVREVSSEASREDVAALVVEMAGDRSGNPFGDAGLAYAEGFVRAYFRERTPTNNNSYRTEGHVPGVAVPTPGLDKHIQNGWINGRNTRLSAQESA